MVSGWVLQNRFHDETNMKHLSQLWLGWLAKVSNVQGSHWTWPYLVLHQVCDNPDSSGSWTKKKSVRTQLRCFDIAMRTNIAIENQSFIYIFLLSYIYIFNFDLNIYNYLHISHSIPIGTLIFPTDVHSCHATDPWWSTPVDLQNWDLADFTTINATQLESCMHTVCIYIYIMYNYVYINIQHIPYVIIYIYSYILYITVCDLYIYI